MTFKNDHTNDDRQEILQRLAQEKNPWLLFVKEPDNPVDEEAVKIMTKFVRSPRLPALRRQSDSNLASIPSPHPFGSSHANLERVHIQP